MKKLRRITEADVIADFLRGEFFHLEYNAVREQFVRIVNHPDLTNDTENRLRRALFFHRREKMWLELPEDRQWWEIELEPADLERVNVFPRAHWIKLARGNFNAVYVAERVRQRMEAAQEDKFAAKMAAICAGMQTDAPKGLILLIGIDERQPVTLLEGNHRFIASMLGPKEGFLAGARLVAGFSPDMEKCCWYKTNFQTLFRCLKNRIQHYWNRDPDVAWLLEQTAQNRPVAGYAEGVRPIKPNAMKSK
jgi:hypothetical protein